MHSESLTFLLKLVLLTLLMSIFFFVFKDQIPAQFFYHGYIGLLLFFFCITFLLHLGYEKSYRKGSKHFVRFYMLASGIKLFGFMTILLVFAFFDKENITAFAITFLVTYFIYTVFELLISYKKFGAEAKLPD